MERKKQFRLDRMPWPTGERLSSKSSRRKDNEEFPGGVKQSGSAADEARESMIARLKNGSTEKNPVPETVEELVQMFKTGQIKPKAAFQLFLDIGDESAMTVKQAKAYFMGHEDSAGARDRMLYRLGITKR